MANYKLVFRIALFLLSALVLAVSVFPVLAFQQTQTEEVKLVFNKDYDVFIGNGGIFIDDSQFRGTLVLKSEQFPEDRPMSWHKFTQRILDFRVYQEDGDPFEWVYGLVRVYFNLDDSQYDRWADKRNNMSIWYFDELSGGWKKCVTHWESVPGLPKGRLWCVVRHYTRYGLAWTQPTILMKMIKLGTITVTPTPAHTSTPTATPTP
jgi:hypothetical protein